MPPKSDIINQLVGLVRRYMGLKTEQVMVYNQKWKIPSDPGLFITVSFFASQVFGAAAPETYTNDKGEFVEAITTNSRETYTFDIFSRDGSAFARKDEIVQAFSSVLMQQLQEKYSFRVATLPSSFVDLSALEGAGILNRYQIALNVLVARTRESIIEYFDQVQNPATKLLINP